MNGRCFLETLRDPRNSDYGIVWCWKNNCLSYWLFQKKFFFCQPQNDWLTMHKSKEVNTSLFNFLSLTFWKSNSALVLKHPEIWSEKSEQVYPKWDKERWLLHGMANESQSLILKIYGKLRTVEFGIICVLYFLCFPQRTCITVRIRRRKMNDIFKEA